MKQRTVFQAGEQVAHLMIVGRGPTGHWISEPRVHLRDAENECIKAMQKDSKTTAFIHRVTTSNGPLFNEEAQ